MKHKKLRSRALLWITLVLALGLVPAMADDATTPAEQTAHGWKVVASSGQVDVREKHYEAVEQASFEKGSATDEGEERWQPLLRGDRVSPGNEIRTGRRSRATLTLNSSIIIVDPRSHLELPDAEQSGTNSAVVQRKGTVLYQVESKSHPHFSVVTPNLVAGVKGTSFLVSINDEYTSVTVEHGEVEITNTLTGERFSLHDGDAIIQDLEGDEMELVTRDNRGRTRAARTEARKLARMETDRGDDGERHVKMEKDRSLADKGRAFLDEEDSMDDDDSMDGDESSQDSNESNDTLAELEQDLIHDDDRNDRGDRLGLDDSYDDDSSGDGIIPGPGGIPGEPPQQQDPDNQP